MSVTYWRESAVSGVRLIAVLAMLVTTLLGAALPTVAQGGSVDVAIYTVENGQSAFDACYVLVGYSDVGCDENADGKVTFADIPLGTYTVQQTADLGSGRSVPDFTINVTGNVNPEGYEGFTATIVSTGGSSSGSVSTGSSDVAIEPTENGQPIYDACFVIVDYSEVGCDENRDGKITFEDIPHGVYIVRQVADLGPNRSMPELRIYVTGQVSPDGWERFPAYIANTGGASGSSDVAIVTTESGQPAYDACYVLVDYSNEGCDENRDGKITFEDIPLGSYTVRQTADLGPGRSVADFSIQVTGAMDGDGWERFPATIVSTGGSSSAGAKDISLITRDPSDGRLLTGTCYVLLDYSNEGCDENGDGQVTFDDMPPGTYTVRQTQTPAGYPKINDFPITIDDRFPNVPVGYLVRQAPEQNTSGTRNVSVVFVDSSTQTKVTSSTCLQFRNVSIVGCDRDLVDGQVDFLDLAIGTHEVTFSNVPAGWQIQTGAGGNSMTIEAGPGPQIIYVGVQTGSGGGATGGGGATTESGAIAVVGGQPGVAPGGTTPDGTTTTGPAVELILDTSGSMNERDQGNQTRLEVAKTVTTRLVTETLPAGVPMALRTYSGCSSSLAIPMQPLDPNTASLTIASVRASGSTPIGQSLRAASADLAGVPGPKIIVLVTDGEETCSGDPRAAIEALVAQDVNVQVNIVGFAIDDATLTATFQEWARVGNGTYFEASNELELHQAVTMASQLSFRVLDQQGTVVANGTVGGDPVSVPVGTYTVEIDTVPVTRHENVVVAAQETVTIDLGTGGATSGGGGVATGSQGPNDQVIVLDGAQGGNAQVIVPDGAQGSGGGSQDTWTASVQVSLCDASSCQAGAGIVVNISLASGEWLGSCTTSEPMPTPWDVYISTCTVEGMPFNADFVATQDPSTIPVGYEPVEDTLTLRVDDLYPGGGDQATFTFVNVRTDTGSGGAAITPDSGTADPMSLLPSTAQVPGGLVETGRQSRTLDEVTANYTDPAETLQFLTAWGWQGNAVASFALPSGQQAQSGQVNGVYVSIHQFGDPDSAREALDFSITEQAAGTDLQEITTRPIGEYTRALYGSEDYGNETTVLVQQGNVLIRVSAAMLDGDPTEAALSVTEAILLKVASDSTTGMPASSDAATTGAVIDLFFMSCDPFDACLNATVTVSTEDGQYITSCTFPHTVEVAPWFCSAHDVPRGIVVALTLDGIVPGWVVEQNPVYWDTTNEPDQFGPLGIPLFTFVQADESSSIDSSGSVITSDAGGSAITPDTRSTGEATLLMTFRGCPEGFDPNSGDFYANCTIPLDAPDASFLYWGGDGQGGVNIAFLDRQHNGEYVHNAGPGTMSLQLSGLAPVVRDGYQVFGADGVSGDTYTVNLVDGETREVSVFYYFN